MSRETFLEALVAEGIPASAGHGTPLYRQTSCPNCETICSTQGVWLEQSLLLGNRQDMDDVADAFEKIYENRMELRVGSGTTSHRGVRE